MQILYITRKDSSKIFGGDEVQYRTTKAFIERKFNVKVDIKCIKDCDVNNIKEYDIIHFWGLLSSSDTNFIKQLKENNKKIIVSSIFWDFTDSILINYMYSICYTLPFTFYKHIQKIIICFITHFLYNIVPQYAKRKDLYLHKNCIQYRKDIILNTDIIIPNSDEEANILCNVSEIDFKSQENKFISIPNAVDIDFIEKHKDTNFMPEVKNFVLEAAGIEPLKNQLGVIKTLYKNPEIPIIFAGQIRNEKYYNKLKKLAEKRGNVYFTGKIAPDDLFSLYKRAKVHVLASFRESPGLATLEALMCGSQIVVSNEKFCPIKYYQFDKYGFVCDPYDIKSIKNAILEAYNKPKDIKLPNDYIKFFSYENVANMTYEVYKKILKS